MRLLSLLLALTIASCATASPSLERARYLMGTVCEIELPPSPAADSHAQLAFAEIDRVERFLSTWKADSELTRVNTAPEGIPHDVSSELRDVLADAIVLARRTGGAFNPLVGPLLDAWKTREDGALPRAGALHEAVRRASLENVTIAGEFVTRTGGAEFEEGGFGKGYALDRALDVLRRQGETRALLNFGGQIAAYGFGDDLEIDIALPDDRETPALRLRISDASVSTSSGSEKTFVVEGRMFSHIFDPRTGEALPPRGSATVIADRALDADALSTALYVLGPQEGLEWADASDVAAIFLTPAATPRTFDVVLSRAARERVHDVRILDPRVHASKSKGIHQ